MTAIDCAGAGRSAELAESILSIRLAPARRSELVEMLAEQSAIYAGLGSGEAERLRGFVLASFENVGLPDGALPFVLEELGTGINPYTVGAAAKALRGADRICDRGLRLLGEAARRIEANDDWVQYETIDPQNRTAARTTALAEIIHTIGLTGGRGRPLIDAMAAKSNVSLDVMAAIEAARRAAPAAAETEHCCCAAPPPPPQTAAATAAGASVDDLELQDQSGGRFRYRAFFRTRPSVLAFFYTRCMNPQKCSLTIGKLAALQRRLALLDMGDRINLAALTYDPAYDRARQLQAYGLERGFRFDERNRFLRCVESFEPIRLKFDLGVGFGSATVNQHSVDLLILDTQGEPAARFSRILWEETEIVEALDRLLGASPLAIAGG